jgi:hypothetical protein
MLNFLELVEAFDEGLVVPYRIGHRGEGLLEVDGVNKSVILRWPLLPNENPRGFSSFKNLEFRTIGGVGKTDRQIELRLDASNQPEATLAFASSIVSQLMGDRDFEASIRSSIHAIRALLQELEVMSTDKALGLLGELLFLKSAIGLHGSDIGLRSWMGPPSGEHDFSLPHAEFEVKTTRSERRVHRISSATQMAPSLGRELYLVSIQLTDAGPAETSFSLPSVINSIRQVLGAQANSFEQYLHEAGWRDWFEEVFAQRYQFRAQPEAFLVDESFPAITSELIRAVVSNGDLVESVTYSVDVAGLSASPGLIEVDQIAQDW